MYFRHFGLSLDAIVNMLQSDSRTQILSSPVIVTEDNTEAVLSSSAQKYFLKGSTVDQFGNVRPETEIRDIGLDLTVKPHINEQGAVMMEISQKVSDEGAPQKISDELGEFPTTQTRSFKASITVQNGETIVLGGLVRKSRLRSNAGIPLLSSIPLFGRLFSAKSDSKSRSEVVVFVTPYVLNTGEQIREESARRKEALDIKGLWRRGWSGSRLADPAPKRLFWRSGGNRTEPAARSPEAGGNRTGVQDRSGTEPDA
jgi:general secretion pathway protein D